MFGWLHRAYDAVTGTIDSAVRAWVHTIVAGLYSFLHSIFGEVGNAWDDFLKDVRAFKAGIGLFIDEAAGLFHHLIKVWIPHFTRWVTKHILDPLLGALRWIDQKGQTVWHYFTHPATLVDLIFEYIIAKLEHTAVATSRKLGRFFLSLFIHHAKELLKLIEDIVDASL